MTNSQAGAQARSSMPRWLVGLLAFASLCVITATVTVIAVLAIFAPSIADEAEELADTAIEDIADEAEAAIAEGLEPTQQTLEEMEQALIDELGPIRASLERVDGLLAAIEQAIAEINARDAELAELQRRAAGSSQ